MADPSAADLAAIAELFADDDDTIDGCDLDFTEHADDDETASLRALFPDGVPVDYGSLLETTP